MLYSPSTNGFYDPRLTRIQPPADAVEISAAAYLDMMAGQEAGKAITPGVGGYPRLAERQVTVIVPASVTRFQARAAMMLAGLLDQVEAAVAASDDPMIRLAWAETVEFPRTSPTIAALAAALGLNDQDVDQLFITASQISA